MAPLDPLLTWLSERGLEIALIVLGSVLLARFVAWAGEKITDRIDARAIEGDALVRSEAAKHRHSLTQVLTWTLVVLIYAVAVFLVLDRAGIPIGGLVAPATVLGVDATLLAARGAVDPQVAAQMAAGVRKALGADWGIATTGVAGPEPQDGQPVGTVFVAVDGPFGSDSGSASGGKVEALRLNGDREEIRMESVRSVLALLLGELAGEQTGNERAQDTEQNGGF